MKAAKFGLTLREMQILNALVWDWSTKETAERFHLAISTVEQARGRIYNKMHVRSGVGAAVKAIREQMVELT